MKLIAEYIDNQLEVITEAGKNGEKSYIIEGIFAQAEQRNRNGRVYPRNIMERAVAKYTNEQIAKKRSVGELNHPEGPTINLDKVSHLITELRWEGNDVVGKAQILDTPMGKIVKGLLDGGVQLGVSTRGMGSLEQKNGTMYVKDDFLLNTVDIVQDPSAPAAFVNGIMEGVNWVCHNGIFQIQECEDQETEITNTQTEKQLYETQVREYKNFLSTLKSNFKE